MRIGAGVLIRGQGVKAPDGHEPDCAPRVSDALWGKRSGPGALGSRDRRAGQCGQSLHLAPLPRPRTWCPEGPFSPLIGIQVGGFAL